MIKLGRKSYIAAMVLLASVATLGIIGGSAAWFKTYVEIPDNKIDGSLRGAYFAYGDGTAEHPYGISDPRHLYNLAWLQFTGYFNRDRNGDGVIDEQYHFELADDVPSTGLDMTGYYTPPIGTEEFPFLGEFDGNGKIVKNLHVTNNYSEFAPNIPTSISSTYYSSHQPQIVGMFGVVGKLESQTYTYDTSINKLYDFGIVSTDIKTVTSSSLIGVAAGYVNGDISGVAVNASSANISAANTAALSYTTNLSDYGVVGFVYENAQGTLKRKKSVTRVDETIYNINIQTPDEFSANDSGDTQGFGGSIDMMELYDRLRAIWNSCTGNSSSTSDDNHLAQYATTATRHIAQNGTVGETIYSTTNLSPASGTNGFTIDGDESYFTNSVNDDRRYFNYEFKDAGYQTSSYGYVFEPGSINNANQLDESRYMCLTGQRSIPVSNGATLTTYYYDSLTGGFIYYDGGNGTINYLHYNGSSSTPQNITATSHDNSTACVWEYSNNKIRTKNLASSTYPNNTYYYLNCSNTGVLSITTTDGTIWSKDTRGYYITSDNDRYYLGFNGSSWTTEIYRATSETYYLIHDGNNYMTHAANITTYGTVSNTSSTTAPTSNECKWYYNNGYFSATASGTQYYLRRTGNNTTSRTSIRYQNSTDYRYQASAESGSVSLKATYDRGNNRYYYFYIYCNNGTWREYTRGSEYKLTVDKVTHAAHTTNSIHSADVAISASRTQYSSEKSTTKYNSSGGSDDKITSYAKTSPTYMPLKETASGSGKPDEKNTGYIVSGAKYLTDPYGDIRVSKFPLVDYTYGSGWNAQTYSASLNPSGSTNYFTQSTGKIKTYYTINDTGKGETATATEIFNNTTKQLESEVLAGESFVYGLHFMNAAISCDNVPVSNQKYTDFAVGQSAYVGKAVINKETFYNYELPTDCIDFNLKEKGYINFVAGTYYENSTYGNNNCFFSLYEIVRDPNTKRIVQLREISEIYSDSSVTNSYQYKYDKAYTYNGVSGQYSVPFKYVNSEKKTLDGGAFTEQSVQANARTGYSSVFKTKWIKGDGGTSTSFIMNAAYYFEIPMNDGEYALGSVSGNRMNGAYLMYLDIGANASKTYRTIFSEHFTTTEKVMEYPVGIAIFADPSSITSTMKTNKEEYTNLSCMTIAAAFQGSVVITRASDSAPGVTITGYQAAKAVPTFEGDNIESNIADKLVPKSTTTKDIRRLQYFDYNVNTQETTHTIITETSTNGGAYARDIKYYDAAGNEVTDQTKWKIYRTKTGVKYQTTSEMPSDIYSTGDNGLYYHDGDGGVLLTFKYWETDTITGETSYNLHVESYVDNEGKTYYRFKDYTVSVTATGGTLMIEVLAVGSGTLIIGNTTVTAVGQTIPISA